MKPSTNNRTAYYRPDVRGLNPGDPATRTLDPRDGKEYTYATTRLDERARNNLPFRLVCINRNAPQPHHEDWKVN